MSNFNLVFFSSSSFVIPIIESVYAAQHQSLKLVFDKQIQWLRDNHKQFVNTMPNQWLSFDIENQIQQNSKLDEFLQKQIKLSLIVSQPDRINHSKTVSNPVVQWARNNQIPLFTPNRINKEINELGVALNGNPIDIAVLASFGQILSQQVLEFPAFGFLNWHPSLLPKYRGPTPMQTAIASGDPITGLSWLEMTKGMDAGDIWLQMAFQLDTKVTFDQLTTQMAVLGANTWSLPIVAKLNYSIGL